jgi:hypothetical protein
MRNRFIISLLIAVCVLLFVGNVVFITKYNNSKRDYINDIYQHMLNIVISFDNLFLAESEENVQYNCEFIENICLRLDSRLNDTMTINEQKVSFSFVKYAENIKHFLLNSSDKVEVQKFILENKEAMLKLIQTLSAKGEFSYNEYSKLVVNPNYRMRLKQTIKIINVFLKEIESNFQLVS